MKKEEFSDYVEGLFLESSVRSAVKNIAQRCAEVANQKAKGEYYHKLNQNSESEIRNEKKIKFPVNANYA
jgi:hypothetical protein